MERTGHSLTRNRLFSGPTSRAEKMIVGACPDETYASCVISKQMYPGIKKKNPGTKKQKKKIPQKKAGQGKVQAIWKWFLQRERLVSGQSISMVLLLLQHVGHSPLVCWGKQKWGKVAA